MVELPPAIAELVDELAATPGAVAVVLGGSRAAGTCDARSDWDLGLYYRGALDTRALAARGTVYPPGAWGRIMNGGAWLDVGGQKVDVLLRDLDVVLRWSEAAARGEYEVDALLGYLAGVPTYLLLAERAVCVVLRGALPEAGGYPDRLAEIAPMRWRFHRHFSLHYARMLAERGDVVGTVGQAAKALLEEAHAVHCERRRWALNDKRMIDAADLGFSHALFERGPGARRDLVRWVARLASSLEDPR